MQNFIITKLLIFAALVSYSFGDVATDKVADNHNEKTLHNNNDCGSKDKCTEMTSCEEAKFYLKNCGVEKLDRDKDGIPCESLCNPK